MNTLKKALAAADVQKKNKMLMSSDLILFSSGGVSRGTRQVPRGIATSIVHRYARLPTTQTNLWKTAWPALRVRYGHMVLSAAHTVAAATSSFVLGVLFQRSGHA